MSCSHVESWVNLVTWLLIVFYSCAANQEPACLLTQLLTTTAIQKFAPLRRQSILRIADTWENAQFFLTVVFHPPGFSERFSCRFKIAFVQVVAELFGKLTVPELETT